MDRVFKALIVSVTGDHYKIVTLLVEDYCFACGQYLEVIDQSKTFIPLSIASSPTGLPHLKILFKPEKHNSESLLLQQLIRQKSIEVSSPKGDVRYPEDGQQILLIVKGTGISQALAMIEHTESAKSKPNIKLIWVSDEESISSTTEHFDCWLSLVDSTRLNEKDLSLWLKKNRTAISNPNCILTGDPDFVYSTRDNLANNQIALNSLQSDVFEYSSL